ncbi:hypothetical protein [Dactylosporangium salmoneum]|uniref:Uncharacterized protein n=1 Tax=Dactylosporangium salmoneum TaxID=53361 RepID=A0ABP5T7B3_9ACTN
MPPRKRTASAATAGAAKKKTDLDAIRAEVANEPDGGDQPHRGDQPYVVAIGDTSIVVKHFLDWPGSADDDLAAGRFGIWASKVLDGDNYAKVWKPMDPTNRQIIAFFGDLEVISGIPFVTRFALPTS